MFVVYIYDPLGNILTQIFNINAVKITQKLNDIGTASFSISLQDENAKYVYFKEMNKIRICRVYAGLEEEMFSGRIRGTNVDFEKIEVLLSDELYILKNKILYTDKTYTGVGIASILTEIINEMNARSATGITLDCSIAETVTKDYKTGKIYIDILKDLAENGYEFQLKNNVLFFEDSVGIDRTIGPDFVEFLYDINDILSKNIDTAESSYNTDNIANAVIVSNIGNSSDSGSITSFTRIERYFSSGSPTELLNERKSSIREIDVTPNTENYFICNLGDFVKVYIDSGSDMLFYDGGMKVVEKTFTSGDLNIFTLKLSSTKIKTLSVLEKISEINTRIGNLEL